MKKSIIYIGLDVDDNSFTGCAFSSSTGEYFPFKSRPTIAGLKTKLTAIKKKMQARHCQLKICYEASYIGYTLLRDLRALNYHCDIISPSSIPRVNGNQIKTDRIDSKKLAKFYANDLLTIIDVPDEESEHDRDILRSRQFIVKQLTELKCHIQSYLRKRGFNFKEETRYKAYWTKPHLAWLERVIKGSPRSVAYNLQLLLDQYKNMERIIKSFDEEVEELATKERYQEQVKALTCYKGIKNTFALTMITEIGDVKRFSHPRSLVSYIGLDIREYSSGGKHNRFGITKHGNRYLRTAFCEANQRGFRSDRIDAKVKSRRKDTPDEYIKIADKCIKRLAKKGNRLILQGKHINKVKVACAREMVGFIWESLNTVAKY